MRFIVPVLAMGFAVMANGQESAAPSTGSRAMDNALRQFARGGPKMPAITSGRQFVTLPEVIEPAHVCSVPLTGMDIPTDVTFQMKTVAPVPGTTKAMPRASVPAPPCATVKR